MVSQGLPPFSCIDLFSDVLLEERAEAGLDVVELGSRLPPRLNGLDHWRVLRVEVVSS